MKRTIFTAAAATALMATTAFADGHMGEHTVAEIAIDSEAHTTLVAAVQAAGLVDTLNGDGPFTVFAPTNDAFAALPEGTVEGLLEPEAKDTLTKILTCHVVGADVMSEAFVGMIQDADNALALETVGGCTFTASVQDGSVMIEDGMGNMATVTAVDLDASNGVVHVIDTVLMPAM